MKQKTASRSIKILVAKLGLDGHDRGALVLCRAFRDAGMEVIYSGLFATPDRIAQIAEDEDVDAVAMSLLNGAHGTLFPRVVKTIQKKGIKDVLIVGGGVIPQIDHAELIKSGVDIGAVANSIDLKSALFLGTLQKSQQRFNRTSADPIVSDFDKLSPGRQLSANMDQYFAGRGIIPTRQVSDVARIIGSSTGQQGALDAQRRSVMNQAGIGGRANQAIISQITRRQIEDNMTVRASAGFYAKLRMKDSNTNRLNLMGATRVEGIPMDEEGAVVGGYSSRREFDQAMKGRAAAANRANQQFGAFFGVGINYSAIYGQSSARSQQSRLNSTVEGIRSSLASAGLSYKTTDARWRRGAGPAHYQYVVSEWAKVRAYNANQVNKAREINTLQQFGQSQFNGSQLSLPSLQDAVARQDEKVSTIGLNRTEAFQIIDTSGRGIDEIDARVLWKNRVNNISTGTSVL